MDPRASTADPFATKRPSAWGPSPKGSPGASEYGSFPEAEPSTSAEPNIEALGSIMSRLETIGLFRSDSMDMQNDPRFFQGSILEKRLAAFSGLGVVSGLMVGYTQNSIRSGAPLELTTFEGVLHSIGFLLACLGLVLNVIATYVSVAQVYHVYRLETSGPIGFEMGVSYYLNPNIVAWRHLAIKCMLLSLPLFLVSTGIELEVKIASAHQTPGRHSLLVARGLGIAVMMMFFMMGSVVFHVHSIHAEVFRDRYEQSAEAQGPYLSRVQNMMTARMQSRRTHHDV